MWFCDDMKSLCCSSTVKWWLVIKFVFFFFFVVKFYMPGLYTDIPLSLFDNVYSYSVERTQQVRRVNWSAFFCVYNNHRKKEDNFDKKKKTKRNETNSVSVLILYHLIQLTVEFYTISSQRMRLSNRLVGAVPFVQNDIKKIIGLDLDEIIL